MQKTLLFTCSLIVCTFLSQNIVFAQNKPGQASKATLIKLLPNQLQWQEAPNSMPVGAKIAYLEGDPTKAGPFTVRLLLPPNYRVMGHSHPDIEHITVIEGEFFLGDGTTLDEKKVTGYPVGSFIVLPLKHLHYVLTRNKTTIVQIQGTGPWDIAYTDVANDPRKQKARPGGAR